MVAVGAATAALAAAQAAVLAVLAAQEPQVVHADVAREAMAV